MNGFKSSVKGHTRVHMDSEVQLLRFTGFKLFTLDLTGRGFALSWCHVHDASSHKHSIESLRHSDWRGHARPDTVWTTVGGFRLCCWVCLLTSLNENGKKKVCRKSTLGFVKVDFFLSTVSDSSRGLTSATPHWLWGQTNSGLSLLVMGNTSWCSPLQSRLRCHWVGLLGEQWAQETDVGAVQAKHWGLVQLLTEIMSWRALEYNELRETEHFQRYNWDLGGLKLSFDCYLTFEELHQHIRCKSSINQHQLKYDKTESLKLSSEVDVISPLDYA